MLFLQDNTKTTPYKMHAKKNMEVLPHPPNFFFLTLHCWIITFLDFYRKQYANYEEYAFFFLNNNPENFMSLILISCLLDEINLGENEENLLICNWSLNFKYIVSTKKNDRTFFPIFYDWSVLRKIISFKDRKRNIACSWLVYISIHT